MNKDQETEAVRDKETEKVSLLGFVCSFCVHAPHSHVHPCVMLGAHGFPCAGRALSRLIEPFIRSSAVVVIGL